MTVGERYEAPGRRRRPGGRHGRRGAVVRVARWSAEHPWRAIGAWIVFVAVCVVGGGAIGTKTQTDVDRAVGEWKTYEKLVGEGRFDDPTTEHVLVTARSGDLDQGRAREALGAVRDRFDALPVVREQAPVVTAEDGTAMLLTATMTSTEDDASDEVQPMRDATAAVQGQYPDLRIEEVGDGSIGADMNGVLSDDFGRAERLSVPITLVILVVAFGALLAAGVPVLLALSSVAAAIGLAGLVSQLMPVDDLLSSVILLVGMAVGVDYSLFYIRRAREERARGLDTLDSVELAAATSGRAVVISGFTVAVAMSGMFLSGAAIFSSFAMGTILVVLVAVVGSLTVLPAVLVKLGRGIDRPRVPLVHRLARRSGDGSRFWSAVLRPALRRPGLALATGTLVLVGLAAPAVGMNLKETSDADLPRSIPILNSYDRLVAAFPSEGSSHAVAVKAPAGEADAVAGALRELARRAGRDDRFSLDGEPAVDVSADRTVSRLVLPVRAQGNSPEAEDTVRLLREDLVPATVGAVPGAEYAVSGDTASSMDFAQLLRDRLPLIIGFVLALSFVLMLWTFRSVVVAATAIALNLLSVGAAYGLLVLVFQHTWAEGLLGFHSNGAIVVWLPMFLFVILFGLSMDYHVFVVSRIQEAALRGMPTREAVRYGITSSAGAVTSAAVVMVAVFSVFATLSLLEFKQMGVGLAAAILLDATLVRAVLLPATMTLLGRWNWWSPALLRRVLPAPAAETESVPPAGYRVPAGMR